MCADKVTEQTPRPASRVQGDEPGKQPSWQGKRFGRYKLLSLLGVGSMGRVFLGEDVNLKRRVALKVLPRKVTDGLDANQSRELFIREARSAARLEHVNVVGIYEVDQVQGMYYIAMELLEGGNLQDLVTAGGPMEVGPACQLIAEAADALEYAHRIGVVHRDIKPSNLMLTRDGRCKVTDFGLARLDDPADGFRLSTEVVGTPKYIAPEVVSGSPAGPASDQYSLMASLWFLLTGRALFEGGSRRDLCLRHVNDPLPDIRQYRKDLSTELIAVLAKGLAKDPAQRYDSCGQLAKVLRRFVIGLGSGLQSSAQNLTEHSGSLGSVKPKPRRLARKPVAKARSSMVWYLIAAGVLGVALLVGVILLAGKRGQDQPPQPGQSNVQTPAGIAPPRSPAASETVEESFAESPSEPTFPAEPVAIQADTAIVPSARARLLNAARTGEKVIVEGRVVRADTSHTGKVFTIFFAGATDRRDFQVVYFPDLFPVMESRFGGVNGSGLAGKTIRVTGRAEVYERVGNPQIILNHPQQVQVVE
jgi:serine/threonine protein kinase